MAGGLFGGKKTRQEQLDELEKKASVEPMYADGAFGKKKKCAIGSHLMPNGKCMKDGAMKKPGGGGRRSSGY